MDLATILGFISGTLLLLLSILAGGDLGAFINSGAVMIVMGGTLAAAFMNFPLNEMLGMAAVMKNALFAKSPSKQDLIKTVVKFAETARKEGILAMENQLGSIDDFFLKKGLQLVIDGAREESVAQIMETELQNIEDRHKAGIEILIAMAGYAPAFGMIGTLIGLVQMLQSLEDPSQIGKGMAVALITTFYGSILANFLFVPIAGKLKRRSKLEMEFKELALTGITGILNGENPRMIQDTLIAYIKPSDREKFSDGKK